MTNKFYEDNKLILAADCRMVGGGMEDTHPISWPISNPKELIWMKFSSVENLNSIPVLKKQLNDNFIPNKKKKEKQIETIKH